MFNLLDKQKNSAGKIAIGFQFIEDEIPEKPIEQEVVNNNTNNSIDSEIADEMQNNYLKPKNLDDREINIMN